MDTYDLVSKHPLLAILRNVPLEKTIDYAEAAVQGGAEPLDRITFSVPSVFSTGKISPIFKS